MNKEAFLSELRTCLSGLPQIEIDAAVDYYSQYIDEADDEAEAIASLGAPDKIAADLITELIVKKDSGKKRGMGGTLKMILLLLFAAPVALPVAMGLSAVLIAVVFAVAVTLLAFGFSALVLMPAGVLYAILGVFTLQQDFAMGLFVLGSGLFALGCGYLLLRLVVRLSRGGFRGTGRLTAKYLVRRSMK